MAYRSWQGEQLTPIRKIFGIEIPERVVAWSNKVENDARRCFIPWVWGKSQMTRAATCAAKDLQGASALENFDCTGCKRIRGWDVDGIGDAQ